jgi:phospholipid/cholesterol/gamma-HCH transport system permease protein
MVESSNGMPKFTLSIEGMTGGAVRLKVAGYLALDNLLAVRSELESFLSRMVPTSLTVDLANLEYVDSAGALALLDFKGESQTRSIPCSFINISESTKGLMSLIDPEALAKPPLRSEARMQDFFTQIGDQARVLWQDFYDLQSFLGELLYALAYCLRYPGAVRWKDVLYYMKRVGVDALPILSLMSLGTGAVIAFLSALQLRLVGATIFVAALIAVAVVEELGVLLTAILVSGRSGSAFAAEIGTMKVREEVDALIAMGFDPIRFLAIPKALAIVIVLPLLTLYSMFFCILGGLLAGVYLLDISLYTYVNETVKNIMLFDVNSSLIKSIVFAGIVSGVGCQRGFQVRGGAEAVGTKTTSAVVTSIFLIAIVECIFAVVLHYVRPWFVP